MAKSWLKIKADLFSCELDTTTNKPWTVISGGATALKYGFTGIEDNAAYEIAHLIEQGRVLMTTRTVMTRLENGKICYKLKDLLGEENFYKTVGKYWFSNKLTDNQKRDIQLDIQLYLFSKADGKYLTTSIPIDSYIALMRGANKIKNKKQRKKFIKNVNREGKYQGVSLRETKNLRLKMRNLRKDIIENMNDYEKQDLTQVYAKKCIVSIECLATQMVNKVSGFLTEHGEAGKQILLEKDKKDRLLVAFKSINKAKNMIYAEGV